MEEHPLVALVVILLSHLPPSVAVPLPHKYSGVCLKDLEGSF